MDKCCLLIFSLLMSTALCGQQNLVKKFFRGKIVYNGSADLKTGSNLGNKVVPGADHLNYEILNDGVYHKILYQFPELKSKGKSKLNSEIAADHCKKNGLMSISWFSFAGKLSQMDWDSELKIQYRDHPMDSTCVFVDSITNDKLVGYFLFDTINDIVRFTIRFRAKAEMLRGDIIINLSNAERLKFAEDFIDSIIF